jgi:hypothetical protein
MGCFPGIKKARFEFPPGILKTRFFQSRLAWPRSVDFPPEINGELFLACFGGSEFFWCRSASERVQIT